MDCLFVLTGMRFSKQIHDPVFFHSKSTPTRAGKVICTHQRPMDTKKRETCPKRHVARSTNPPQNNVTGSLCPACSPILSTKIRRVVEVVHLAFWIEWVHHKSDRPNGPRGKFPAQSTLHTTSAGSRARWYCIPKARALSIILHSFIRNTP